MSSTAEVKDASYLGPVAAATPTADPTAANPGTNTIRRASSSTNTSEALASVTGGDGRPRVLWAGKFVDIKNESPTDYLDFAFSRGAQTLVYGQTGTFGTGNAAAGWRIDPGQTISVVCPPGATHANWILSAAGPSTVALRCSEGNVGDK